MTGFDILVLIPDIVTILEGDMDSDSAASTDSIGALRGFPW